MQDLIVAAETTYGLTNARLVATAAALLALGGVIVGWRVRRGKGSGRGAMVAAVTGVVTTVVGVIALAVADGGPGTGNGVVGAWAAVVLGPVALVLGGMGIRRAGVKT